MMRCPFCSSSEISVYFPHTDSFRICCDLGYKILTNDMERRCDAAIEVQKKESDR